MDRSRFRSRVAEAVHWAVCEFTQGDGFGRCMFYSFAGSVLLSRLTGRPFLPQAGSLWVLAEPPNVWLEFDVRHGDDVWASMERGEYHCWIAEATSDAGGFQSAKSLIDLSSRHFKAFAERCDWGEPVSWLRPDPPSYVWLTGGLLPDWVCYKPVEAAMTVMLREFVGGDRLNWSRLAGLAIDRYERLLEEEFRSVDQERLRRERDRRRQKRKAERQRRKAGRR